MGITTSLLFKQYNGDTIRINGVIQKIPAAGVASGLPTDCYVNGVSELDARHQHLHIWFLSR